MENGKQIEYVQLTANAWKKTHTQ